jgi:DNA-binding transcriptional MocR family regulator
VRFEGEPPPTLFELDGGERVLHSSSFSKIVAPGARVGYLVLPEALAAKVEAHATSTYITPALLSQATVFEFLRRGALERNIELVRSLLKARRDAMLAALDEHLGGTDARWNRPEGGYFLWLDLPEGVDVLEVLQAAQAAGVTFVPGPDFFPRGGGGGRSAARLAFSFASPGQIADGVGRLAATLGASPAVELRQQHAA